MKNLLATWLLCSSIFISGYLLQDSSNIKPKSGTIEIPAKGEYRMWQNVKHSKFTVTLTNSSKSQSVELYKVKSDGNEKWVNPSLLANSSLDLTIPADGHLLIKNFNKNVFMVNYKVAEK